MGVYLEAGSARQLYIKVLIGVMWHSLCLTFYWHILVPAAMRTGRSLGNWKEPQHRQHKIGLTPQALHVTRIERETIMRA